MPRETLPAPRGRVRMHAVPAAEGAAPREVLLRGGWRDASPWSPNLVLKEWGAIVSVLLAQGLPAYRISAMYLEFENSADPDTPSVAPTYDRGPASGIDYYAGLLTSPDRDYLRVPLVAAVTSSSDPVQYPRGNMVTFFAQTSGVSGVHGKPFSDAHNSRVFGCALVAMVDPADATQDLVLSRIYLAPSSQQVKLPTSQVGVEWEIALN